MTEQPTLESERLRLRPFQLSDALDVRRMAGDRRVADTTLNIPHPYEEGMAEEWITTHGPGYRQESLATFAITLRDSAALIGAIGLSVRRGDDCAELGYWIGIDHWNQGYCTEAAHRVLAFGFQQLRLNRVHASHMARNPASGRVMAKLGMRSEGIRRQHVKKWNKYEDLAIYGLLQTELKGPA